jgi:hypothetical protein
MLDESERIKRNRAKYQAAATISYLNGKDIDEESGEEELIEGVDVPLNPDDTAWLRG